MNIVDLIMSVIKGYMSSAMLTDVIYGVVKTVEPLSIQIAQNIILPKEALMLSAQVQETIIKIPKDAIYSHRHQIDWELETEEEDAGYKGVDNPPGAMQDGDIAISVTVAGNASVVPPMSVISKPITHKHKIIMKSENFDPLDPLKEPAPTDLITSNELPEIKLWRGLAVNDIVRLMRIQNGGLYYVLERNTWLIPNTDKDKE